jgi:hypothetical protein
MDQNGALGYERQECPTLERKHGPKLVFSIFFTFSYFIVYSVSFLA